MSPTSEYLVIAGPLVKRLCGGRKAVALLLYCAAVIELYGPLELFGSYIMCENRIFAPKC